MVYRELTPRELIQMLKRWQRGASARKIARVMQIDRKTVGRYILVARGLGLQDRSCHASDVESIVRAMRAGSRSRPSPACESLIAHEPRIADWLLGDPPLQLSAVRALLQREGVSVTYATLRRFAINRLGWRSSRTGNLPEPAAEARVAARVDHRESS